MKRISIPVRVVVAVATALVSLTAVGSPGLAQTDSIGAGGEYFSVTPTRVFDRRVGANSTTEIDVWVESSGIARGDILAVAANITLAGAQGTGYVSAAAANGPADATPTSLLNTNTRGDVVPNFGIIGVDDARLDVSVVSGGAGTNRLIVDVVGYVTTSSHTASRGARLIGVTPERILDTRASTPIGPEGNRTVNVSQRAGVGSNATAAVVNITGINTRPESQNTYLTASASPVPRGTEPESSNGNYRRGDIVASLAIVELDESGNFNLYNRSGSLNVAVDIVGYLEPRDDSTTTGRILALQAPFRTIDTRAAAFGGVKLGAQQWEDLSFDGFTNSITLDGQAVGNQGALFANVTAVAHERARAADPANSYLSLNPAYPNGAYPQGDADNSNINVVEGRNVANAAIVSYGTKAGDDNVVSVFNRRGDTHYIVDAFAIILD
ncbi:MAG: hypothetical protein ABJH68_15560 [Ilumatobacter sp.]|uniref:hypothetical protein n=1 Tax=Ilumatobacter sp. TaxID=1967498 RepID=UPI003299835F